MRERIFYLKQGNTVLGLIHQCDAVEMFWWGCVFDATAAFSEFRDLFEELSQKDCPLERFLEIQQQIKDLGIYLLDSHDNSQIYTFVMRMITDRQVEIRYTSA